MLGFTLTDWLYLTTGAITGLLLPKYWGRKVLLAALFAGLFYTVVVALGIKTGQLVWPSHFKANEVARHALQMMVGCSLALLPELGLIFVILGVAYNIALFYRSFRP